MLRDLAPQNSSVYTQLRPSTFLHGPCSISEHLPSRSTSQRGPLKRDLNLGTLLQVQVDSGYHMEGSPFTYAVPSDKPTYRTLGAAVQPLQKQCPSRGHCV